MAFRQIAIEVESTRLLLLGAKDHAEPYIPDADLIHALQRHNSVLLATRQDVDRNDTKLGLVQNASDFLRTMMEEARHNIELQCVGLAEASDRLRIAEREIQVLKQKMCCLGDIEGKISTHERQISTLHETSKAMDLKSLQRFEANQQSLSTVKLRLSTAELIASRLESRIDRLKEDLRLPAGNVVLPSDLHAETGPISSNSDDEEKAHLTYLLGVFRDQLENHEAAVEQHDKQLEEHSEAIKGKARITIEDTVCAHASRLDTLQEKLDKDAECDIPTMLTDLRRAEMQLRGILEQLKSKVSYDDLDSNIEVRYSEILAYLQSTLQATEEEDGDLRQETKILRRALNEIRATKADRGDLAQLRAQITSRATNAAEAEIESIKEELGHRPRLSEVCKLLSSKVSFVDLKESLMEFEPAKASNPTDLTQRNQIPRTVPCATASGYPDLRRVHSEFSDLSQHRQCLSCETPLMGINTPKGIQGSSRNEAQSPGLALIPHRSAVKAKEHDRKPLYVSALPPPTLPRVIRHVPTVVTGQL